MEAKGGGGLFPRPGGMPVYDNSRSPEKSKYHFDRGLQKIQKRREKDIGKKEVKSAHGPQLGRKFDAVTS